MPEPSSRMEEAGFKELELWQDQAGAVARALGTNSWVAVSRCEAREIGIAQGDHGGAGRP